MQSYVLKINLILMGKYVQTVQTKYLIIPQKNVHR